MYVKKVEHSPFSRQQGADPQASSRMGSTSRSHPTYVEPVVMSVKPSNMRNIKPNSEAKTMADVEFKPLVIRWRDDYDILSVHQKVIQYLKGKKERKEVLGKNLSALKSLLGTNLLVSEAASIRTKIAEIERTLETLQNSTILSYLNGVSPIIEEYRKLSESVPVILGQKQKKDALGLARKTKLVTSFFEIAKNYCPLDLVRDIRSSGFCSLCSGYLTEQDDKYVCNDCGVVRSKMEIQDEGGDNQEDGSRKTSHNTTNNFRDIVLQAMAAYPINIPDRVLESIKDAMAQYQTFDIAKLSRGDLVRIMKDLGLGSWYKHLNKIYMLLTDKKPMDISVYSHNLCRRGELLYEIYDDIKSEDRSNFLHGLHLLWLFLKNEGCEPNMDEFVLLKSRSVELNNIETLQRGFDILKSTHPEFSWIIYQIP